MERDKKSRSVNRRLFTKQYNLLKEYIEEEQYLEARGCFTTLETYMANISELDNKIMDHLLEDKDASEDDLVNEASSADEYRSKFDLIKVRVFDISYNLGDQKSVSDSATTKPNYSLRLPKVELRKFSGDLKEWLPFWNQFQQIHEDESIPAIDKFYFLDQAIVQNSRARRVLDSFPPTKENYPLVINAMKERFGREDLLIEIYIRDLLSLTLPCNKSCSLADMYDKLECRLRALEVLGVTKGKCAAILCPLLESCMSEDFLRVWQRSYTDKDMLIPEQRLERFMVFMKSEVQNEERINVAMSGFGKSDRNLQDVKNGKPSVKSHKPKSVFPPTATGLLTLNDNRKPLCIFCDDYRHNSANCYKARNMSLADRIDIVRSKKCCLICMKGNHLAKTCKFRQKCTICDKRHVLLLCPNLKRSTSPDSVLDSVNTKAIPAEENVLANMTSDNVLLPTIMVKIRGNGVQKMARAVLDTGSQRSYILKRTAHEMKYSPIDEENIIHSLFGGQKSDISKHNKYKLYLSSIDGKYLCNFDVLDQETICDSLPHFKDGPWMKELNESNLSTEVFLNNSGIIEILIGADVVAKLFTGNVKTLSCGLSVIETKLGWAVMGKIPNQNPNLTSMIVTSMLVKDLNISDLWKLDLLGISDPTETKTKLETQQDVDKMFKESLKINSEGRYEVKLLWKENHPPLPSNHDLALKRLDSTVKKLHKDGMFDTYQEVFNEWLEDGVIEKVPTSELRNVCHYLPHRHVVKENSTTRVRPVFDASAHEARSPSLNDCLEKGRNLLEQIPHLLLCFRMKKVGVVADIKRAFLQISVSPDDRDYLRFLWKSETGDVTVYRHRRVVFGVVCSPYQLNAVIQHHLSEALEKCHKGNSLHSLRTVDTLIKSFYVDNVVTSVENKDELDTLILEARAIMAEGKFDLRGWEFTNPVLQSENNLTNVLGLVWNRKEDTLSINYDTFRCPEKVTKRTILSTAHSVFDPIGFTSPVILEPKLLLRKLWNTKHEWDEEVDSDIRDKFIRWMRELKYLSGVKIRRWLLDTSESGKWSVHTFCDASESAYAAAVFLRVETSQGVSVQLIQAKSRVAPIKYVTIPRLELLAALIGSRLHQSVIDSLPEHCTSYFWSDSTTVLAWIHRDEQWAPFVRNRVAEIRNLTKPEQWSHVPGVLNPADLPSRGCSAKQLLQYSWWEGPSWLRQSEGYWPSHEIMYDEDSISVEKLKGVTCMVNKTPANDSTEWLYKYFSKYDKIVRMVAWMRRFINNCRAFKSDCYAKTTGPLSLKEIQTSEIKVLKLVQKQFFTNIKDPKITSLQVFEDLDGLFRVRTRISNRPDTQDFRYPVLLPKEHPVVSRLIMDTHVQRCHAGTQSLLAILREKFWILGGRRNIRSVITKCMQCKRQDVKNLKASTPPLPVERVRDAAAFEVTGVDLAGPVYLKNGEKSWICLFTCGVVRAVHLELLLSLTTEDFLQAFRRFVAQRGRPAIIFSDNGTNFTGAERSLNRLNLTKVHEYCTVERIQWKFNPPTAPWWGGFFERLIGLVKRVLRKVLGRSSLNYTEMETVLCECESIINARPLTYVSDDLNELVAITPAMFIQDIREAGVPEIDIIESSNFQKRLKYRAKLREDLRKRFRSEYLGQLRQHIQNQHDKIKVGDIVMLANDNCKRLDWPLAKVTELIPGKDGTVRLVRLKIANGGNLLRPIQRLYPMLEGEIDPVKTKLPLVIPTASDAAAIKIKHGETTVPSETVLKMSQDSEQSVPTTRCGRKIQVPQKYLD